MIDPLAVMCQSQLFGLYRFSGVERLKDKAAAAAQAILEPGIATDGGQQMSRQQFGTFVRRFAAASGLSFSAITDFLLVVPVFDYDPAFMDPGKPKSHPAHYCCQRIMVAGISRCIRHLKVSTQFQLVALDMATPHQNSLWAGPGTVHVLAHVVVWLTVILKLYQQHAGLQHA